MNITNKCLYKQMIYYYYNNNYKNKILITWNYMRKLTNIIMIMLHYYKNANIKKMNQKDTYNYKS